MMHRFFIAAATLAMTCGMNAAAQANDAAFFRGVAGTWSGPGKIVAGKYAGTEFNCQLSGVPTAEGTEGVELDGKCRVGVFQQDMAATIAKTTEGYKGSFLDGAAGDGLDIVSGRVDGDRVIMVITRKKLEGVMVATLSGRDAMNVTVSVKVGETLVPVIGMDLTKTADAVTVGSIR